MKLSLDNVQTFLLNLIELWLLTGFFSCAAASTDCLDLARFSPQRCEIEPPRVCTGYSTRGLFSSCQQEYLESCVSLAQGILTHTLHIPLTIFVDEDLFHDANACAAFTQLTKRPEASRLQLVPVEKPAKFMRDPGVLLSTKGIRRYLALPYGMKGAKSVAAALTRCKGFEVQRGFKESDSLTHQDIYADSLDSEIYPHRMEGGNVLWSPQGPLFIGQPTNRKISDRVLQTLAEHHPVVRLPLPSLRVGHIDEVLSLVGSPTTCGLSILAASPREMKAYLRSRQTDNLPLLATTSERQLPDNIRESLMELENRILLRKGEGRPIPVSWLKIKEGLVRKALLSKRLRNLSAADILKDTALMARWEEWQQQVDRAKQELRTQLAAARPACTQIRVIDLPIFWNHQGVAPFTNPINGIFSNGRYLLSRPHRLLLTGAIWNAETSDVDPIQTAAEFTDFEKEIVRRLPDFDVRFLPLPQYDLWGGNLHCATLQIQEPCIN